MKIGVDLISGESAIEELVKGCIDAVVEEKDIEVVMIGKSEIYQPILDNKKFNKFRQDIKRISIMEVTEVITMEDDPLTIVKQKKGSSIVKGLQAHKNKEIDAFFSPGNTGAIVVAASLVLGRVKGVKKPALITPVPNSIGGSNVFLDVGASAECEADDLVKFAVMGRIYSQEFLGIKDPRVGLLNIGEEAHKGNASVKATYKKLKEIDGINFLGNVEGYEIFSTDVDVIVCDGYIGNIALKTMEGAGKTVTALLKKAIKEDLLAMLTVPFYKGALKSLKRALDPEVYGGVPLVGVNGNVFIGHGKSGRQAIKFGIKAAANSVRFDITGKLRKQVEALNLSEN